MFHIDEASGLGYVVASQDLSSGAYDTSQPGNLGYEWGCYGVNVSTGLGIGSGESNTESIASNCSSPNGITAAQAALNHSSGGYDDWFLPSRDEFLAMTSFEDFNDGWYFSSSQFSSTTQAWFVAPNNDDQNASSKKIFTLQVRPIRTFDWSPLVVVECGNQMDGTSRSSSEFCMPCMTETFSPDDLSDCMSVSECYPGEYETMVPTETSDRICSPVSECYLDEYEFMAPTPTSDRECSVVRECSDNEYESMAPTATSNRICETIVMGCMDETDYNYNVRANTSDNSCSTACFYPEFMDSNSDFESPNIGPGDVLYVYYNNEYITHFTTSTSDVVSGSTPGYSGYGPRYFGSEHEPGVSYYAGGLSALTSINEANYPYWVGAGDEYIFDTRSFSEGGDTHDGVGNFSWINWTSKNIKISQSRCFGATSCTVDQFELQAPTPVSDRACSDLTVCASDEFVSMAATTTSDRLCSPIRTICASDEYVSVAASPGLSDIECSPVRSICTSDEYISMAPISGLFDIQCSSVRTSCSSGEFVSMAALPGLLDIECSALSDCTAGEYESMAPTATSDRSCSALSECSADEYELVAATTTSDRICETIVKGCTDAAAYNFDSNANTDDGSCETLDLPSGWSMFGYTCMESKDPITAFEGYAEKIIIVKDEMGLSYLPEYNFNALGNLKHTEGYQIKLKERLVGFKFCEPVGQVDVDAAFAQGVASVTPDDGVSQADVDAAEAAVHASYEGWCASDLDNDGLCDDDEVSGCIYTTACNYLVDAEFDDGSCVFPETFYDCESNCLSDIDADGVCDELEVKGCMDATACNYVADAEFDDDSCEYESCLDECGVFYGDNSSCALVNGEWLHVGDVHEGGMIFQINDDGTGLVANLQDSGSMNWYAAISAAESSNSLLPSKQQLQLIYNTIGNGGASGNVGGLENAEYWSSSEFDGYTAYFFDLRNNFAGGYGKSGTLRVRLIRAF